MNEATPGIPVTCSEIADRGLIECYVTGTLGPSDVEVLEEHYLTCDRCREEVRLAAAIHGAMAGAVATPRRWPGRWSVYAALALAAGVGAVMLLRAPADARRWRDLGDVRVAPIYLGLELRAEETRPDSLFGAAMSSYAGERYADAESGLRAALAAGVDSAPAEFFLAATLLMRERPAEAVRTFSLVIARADSLYLAEAFLYRAKALLRVGKPDAALSDLHAVGSGAGPVAAWARALADSIMRRLPR